MLQSPNGSFKNISWLTSSITSLSECLRCLGTAARNAMRRTGGTTRSTACYCLGTAARSAMRRTGGTPRSTACYCLGTAARNAMRRTGGTTRSTACYCLGTAARSARIRTGGTTRSTAWRSGIRRRQHLKCSISMTLTKLSMYVNCTCTVLCEVPIHHKY